MIQTPDSNTQPSSTEPMRHEPEAGLTQPSPTTGETNVAGPSERPKDIAAVEAAVAVEWNVGDVILDTYEVKEVVGEGGFGKVYRVHHRNWNVDLAVKCPLPDKFTTEVQKENFTHECETWIKLGLHPHIVSCHYVRTLGGIPRVFAEYMEGGSLHDWISDGRLYDVGSEGSPEEIQKRRLERILDIAIQFAWGLHYAHEHEQHVIHQDVKPRNVLMTLDGMAKATDFGLASAHAALGGGMDRQEAGHSMVVRGAGFMTPEYASPEQAAGKPLTRKTDIWSWAVSLFEMFVGEMTWCSGSAVPELLENYLKTGEDHESIPSMPETVVALLKHCLQTDPSARPKDMAGVAFKINAIYQQVIGEAYPREEPKRVELLAGGINNKALSMLDLDKKKDAENLFDEALKSNPHHAEATYNRGLLFWRSSRITDACLVERLQDLQKACPGDWQVAYLLGLVHLERDDAVSAVKVLEGIPQDLSHSVNLQDALMHARRLLPTSARRIMTFPLRTTVESVFLGADGHYALSGSSDKSVKLWQTSSGHCVKTFLGHLDSVTSVVLSSNGNLALSGSSDKTIKLWDVESGRCLRTFAGHNGRVISLCFSSHAHFALSGGSDKMLKLWNVRTGACLFTFGGYSQRGCEISSVCLSPDCKYALVVDDGDLKLWDVASGRCIRTYQHSPPRVCCACLSRNGQYALSGNYKSVLELWETMSGRHLRTLQGHNGRICSVTLSEDGHLALSASEDDTLKLWDTASGRCLRTFEGRAPASGLRAYYHFMRSAYMSIDGRFAVSAGAGGIEMWKVLGNQPYRAAMQLSAPVSYESVSLARAAFNKHIKKAKSALGMDNALEAANEVRRARDVPGMRGDSEAVNMWRRLYVKLPRSTISDYWEERKLQGHDGGVVCTFVSPDCRYALSGSNDRTVKLWMLSNGSCVITFKGHHSWINCVCLSSDARYALSGSSDRTIKLWEVSSGRCLRTFEGSRGDVYAVSFSKDDRYVLSGQGCSVSVWEVATGRRVRLCEGHKDGVVSVIYSADCRYALSGSADKTLKLWDIAKGRCLRTYEGHSFGITSVWLTSDCQYALSGSEDRTLKLWQLNSGHCLRTFAGHENKIKSIALSADDRFVISADGHNGLSSRWGSIRLWEIASGKCLRTFPGQTNVVSSVSLSADGGCAVSGSYDNTIKVWTLDWDLENVRPADWDERAKPYLETFLTLHCPVGADGFSRVGQPAWTEEDFQRLLTEMQCRGYGWLRPEGVRRQLEKMKAEWQGSPPMPWESPTVQTPVPATHEPPTTIRKAEHIPAEKFAEAGVTILAPEPPSAATFPATSATKKSPAPKPQPPAVVPQSASHKASPIKIDSDLLRNVIRRAGDERQVLQKVLLGWGTGQRSPEARRIYDEYVKALPPGATPPEFCKVARALLHMANPLSGRLLSPRPAGMPRSGGQNVPASGFAARVCSCGTRNPFMNQFCTSCGKPLPAAPCPQCQKLLPAGVSFCVHCGAKLASPK